MADLVVRGIIELILKGTGGKEAQKQLEDVSRALGTTKERLEAAVLAGRQLLAAFGVGFGVVELARLIKASITDFARLERGFNAIAFTMERVGIDSKKAIPEVREFLQGLQAAGGGLQTETLPILQRFIGITHDVQSALFATKLASDAAESGLVDINTAGTALSALLQGRAKLAAQTLGIELVKLNGIEKSQAELVAEVTKNYFGLGDSIDDTEQSLNKLSASWARLKETIGSSLAPVVKWFADVADGTNVVGKALGAAGLLFEAVFNTIGQAAIYLGRVVVNALDFKRAFTNPEEYLRRIESIVTETGDAIYVGWAKFIARSTSLWQGAGEQHGQAYAEGMAKFQEQARRKAQAAELEEQRKFQAKMAQETLRSQIEAEEQGSRRRFELERELLRAEEQAAIEEIRRKSSTVGQLEEEFAKQRAELAARIAREGETEKLKIERDALERTRIISIEEARSVGAQIERVRAEYGERRKALEAEEQRERAQQELDAERELLRARADAAAEMAQPTIEVDFGISEEASRERLAAELALLDAELEEKLTKIKDNEEAIAALRLAHAMDTASKILAFERQALERQLAQRTAAIEKEGQIEREAAEAAGDAELAAVEERIAGIENAQQQIREYYGLQQELARLQSESEVEAAQRALDLEVAKLEAKEEATVRELDLLKEIAAARAQAEGASPEEVAAIEEEFEERKTRVQQKAATERAKIQEIYSNRVIAILARLAARQKALDKDTEQAKREQAFMTAEAAVGFLTAAFGRKKAIAVAEAIIYTARGITEAFPNAFLMALIAATGALQIRKILSTNIGSESGGAGASAGTSATAEPEPTTIRMENAPALGPSRTGSPRGLGFDEPLHDLMAKRWGRRQAEDLVAQIGGGYLERMQELTQAPSPVVIREISADAGRAIAGAPARAGDSTTYQVTINGMFGGRQGLRDLERALVKVREREQSRRIS